jgi:hypothetical protein
VGLRERFRKLQRAAEQEKITFELEDGTTARFHEDEVWPECFLHEFDRGKRHSEGEDPGPAHPFVEALRNAAPGEVEHLVPTQGTAILLFSGEDEIMCGGRRRPRPPVRESSPGVYE